MASKALAILSLCLWLIALGQASPVHASPCDDGDHLYCEDFEGFPEQTGPPAGWTLAQGPTSRVGVGSQTANSPTQSLFQRGNNVRVESPVIDLSDETDVLLSFWVSRGHNAQTTPNENVPLTIEYRDAAGDWQELDTIPGGFDVREFFRVHLLPPDALHANMQLSFRHPAGACQPGGQFVCYWHVDDIVVGEPDAVELLVEGQPEEWLVEVGDDVEFEALAFGCDDDFLRWRDTWDFGDGPVEEVFEDSSCQRSPVTNSHVFDAPGIYEVEYTSEYCDAWFFLWCVGDWVEHGSDTVTVTVEESFDEASILFDYRMEEDEWTGGSGQVIDSSGNGLHATPSNADTRDQDPAIPGDPGSCRYADLRGDGQISRSMPAAANDAESFSVGFWLRMGPDPEASIFALGNVDGLYAERFEILQRSTGSLAAVFRYQNGTERLLDAGSTAAFNNEWVHVAVTRRIETIGNRRHITERLFLEGNIVDQAENDFSPGQQPGTFLRTANGNLNIAGYAGGQFSANAFMDEVQFYEGALTQSEVQAIRNRTFPCGADLAYFIIDAPSNASVCAPADITVTAYDENDSILSDYTGTVDLQSSSGRGVFDPGSTGPGQAQYLFQESDNGSASFTLSNESADGLTISVSDADAGVTSVSDPIQFSENAFELSWTDALGQEIVAGRPHAMEVSALRQDPGTGECGLNSNYQGSVGLKAWMDRSTQDPGGIEPSLAGTPLPDAPPGSNNLSLEFSAGQASVQLETSDVGQYRIGLLDDSSGLVVDEEGDPIPVSGESAQATVRPFGFAIDEITMDGQPNPGTVGPGGDVFGVAGDEFTARLMAVQYQPEHDSSGDGVPDEDAVLSPVDPTPAFAANGQFDRMDDGAWFSPEEGIVGDLMGGGLDGSQFIDGSKEFDELRYSEVGSITLEARVDDYLGAGLQVIGRSERVGRFRADRFQVDVEEDGAIATSCNASFSYLREDLAYDENPRIRITPVNRQGQHTQNYARFPGENWWPLPEIEPEYIDQALEAMDDELLLDTSMASHSPPTDQPQLDENGDINRLLLELNGTLAYQFAADETPLVAPFDSDLRMRITLEDPDGVAYQAPDDGSAEFEHALPFNESAEQRQGRLHIGNAHGSDRLDLAGTIQVQFYAGESTGWRLNSDDVCTTGVELAIERLSGAGDTCIIEPDDDSGVGCNAGESGKNWQSPPQAGDFNAWFRRADSVGSHRVTVEDIPDWLQYDWSASGEAHDESPSGIITFGIHRGPDNRIDLREVIR